MTNILLLPQISVAFTLYTNSDWLDTLQFTTSSTATTPLDLTGIDFECQIRSTITSDFILAELSTYNGFLINGATNGQLTFSVSAVDFYPNYCVSRFPPGSYIADLVAKADGKQINLCQTSGPMTITVTQGVTR